MGPLEGFKIVEIAGIGPAPFAGMMLSDMGADVIRVDRADVAARRGIPEEPNPDASGRGRRSIAVDLKNPDGVATVLELVASADALIEGFRPGVAERLGIGPNACHEVNPKLVYGRMTGWGQEGPYAPTAGHDLNYIALSGVLSTIGRAGERPVPPLNLVGDFGGGGMLLAFGVLAGMLNAQKTGAGQTIDAAMVDGAALLATMVFSMRGMGMWHDDRGTNMLDTGAPFYDVYECSDGEYVSIGSIEPQFYAELMRLTDLGDMELPDQHDRSKWPEMKDTFAAVIARKTRAEWAEIMEGTDVCFAPVLSMTEAPDHPHNKQRGTFIEVAGRTQPAPAPRFDKTPAAHPTPSPHAGQHTDEVLAEWGLDAEVVAARRAAGALY